MLRSEPTLFSIEPSLLPQTDYAQQISELYLPKREIENAHTFRSAWQNTNIRDALSRIIKNGLLKQSPVIAQRAIEKITELVDLNLPDKNFSLAFHEFLTENNFSNETRKSYQRDEYHRVHRRVQQITTLIQDAPTSYLDIGCGNGQITSALMEKWNLSKRNTYGADVFNRVESDSDFEYLKVSQCSIPLPTETINLTTMLMTLHHEKTPRELLAEVFRVLEPGGQLLIRDHNAETESDKLLFEALDIIYFSLLNDLDDVPVPANYQSMKYWENLAKEIGFSVVQSINPEPESPIKPFHLILIKAK